MPTRPYDHRIEAPDLSARDSALRVADALAARIVEGASDVYSFALASSYLELRKIEAPVRAVGGWMA